MISATNSAVGNAYHIPFTPNNLTNNNTNITINNSVLTNNKIADTLLFDSAVNIAEVKTFSILNRYDIK